MTPWGWQCHSRIKWAAGRAGLGAASVNASSMCSSGGLARETCKGEILQIANNGLPASE